MSDKETIVIVGSTGAGKSTSSSRQLVALIQHFRDLASCIAIRRADGGDQDGAAYWDAQCRRTLRNLRDLIELAETDR
jgi:ABC-type multidrug transport system fused ATPase/permease subunit